MDKTYAYRGEGENIKDVVKFYVDSIKSLNIKFLKFDIGSNSLVTEYGQSVHNLWSPVSWLFPVPGKTVVGDVYSSC